MSAPLLGRESGLSEEGLKRLARVEAVHEQMGALSERLAKAAGALQSRNGRRLMERSDMGLKMLRS